MYPKISVIIVNWNGKHFLKECIDALLDNSYKNFEIIIVENGSIDGSKEFLEKIYLNFIKNKKLRIIHSTLNLGFAGGNNLGYQHVDKVSKYVTLLNNDTKVNQNWMLEMFKIIEYDDECGGVCAIDNNLVSEDTSWFNYKNLWFTCNLAFSNIVYKQRNTSKKRIPSISLAGCSFMFRKSLIKMPFDTDYFAYAEDMYLSRLIILKGYKLYYATKAYLHHYTESTKKRSQKLNKFLLFHGIKNNIMNFFIFYNDLNIKKLFPFLILNHIAMIFADPKRFLIILKSYLWILRNIDNIKNKRKQIQSQRKIKDEDIIRLESYKIYSELNLHVKLNIIHKILIWILNGGAFLYCKLLKIRTMEFY